jgi:outer membrane protein TolC
MFKAGFIMMIAFSVLIPLDALSQPLPATLWEQTIRNNPMLESYRHRLDAREKAIEGIGIWPALELEAGILTRPMEQMMGDQRFSFSAMQMLPRNVEFKAQRNETRAMLLAETALMDETALMLRRELTEAWVKRVALAQEMNMMDEALELMYQMQDIVRARVSTDGSSSDWLRLELRIVEMEDEHIAMEDMMDAVDQMIWSLTGDSLKSPIPLADSLTTLSYSIPRLAPDFSNHPSVRKYQAESDAATARSEMANSMLRPMIGVGIQYIPFKPRSSMGESTSGADMIMPMVTVSIPNSRAKIRIQSEIARSEALSMDYEMHNRISELQIAWAEAIAELKQSERNITTSIRQRALSKELYDTEVSRFQTGMGSIDMLLDIQQNWINYRFKALEAIMKQRIAIAQLEELQPEIAGNTQNDNK